MELDKVIMNRRSTREFSDKLVSKKDIGFLIEAFSNAPSSCNLQLSNLILINDKKLLKKFEKHVTGKISWTKQFFVVTINTSINKGNHAHYLSAGMAIENLMLKAEEIGIATCPIAGFENKDYLKKELKVPKEYDIPLLVFFGYKKQKNDNPLVKPYRTNNKNILSINTFQNQYFMKRKELDKWSKEDIIEYRKRIFSVYYPRFRHGLWRNSLNDLFLDYYDEKSKFLYYFFWEKGVLDSFSKNDNFHVCDIFEDYEEFLQSHHNMKISKLNEKSQLFDKIFIANTLEFEKDLDLIFSDISNKLTKKGSARIIFFNTYGIFALFFKFLSLIKYLDSVYEKSPFYKIGPYRFISRKEISKLTSKHGLEIISDKKVSSTLLEDKIKNKYFKYLIQFGNKLFPENIVIDLKKK